MHVVLWRSEVGALSKMRLRLRRFRKLRRIFILVLFLGVVGLFCMALISYFEEIFSDSPPPSGNYFADASESRMLDYIVDTPTCHILNISASHPSILSLLRNISTSSTPAEKCRLSARKWTYVDEVKQLLILNETAIQASGFSLSSISCCYKPIRRVSQSLEGFDANADSIVEISSTCHPVFGRQASLSPTEQYIRVHCFSKYWPWTGDIVYRYFHATPIPTREVVARKREIRKGRQLPPPQPPPSVLLLGIDSMSRLSFIRNMPRTRNVLKDLGAVEMMGYTKLGENTYPNWIALMTGDEGASEKYSGLSPPCIFEDYGKPLDGCPFIWKDFSDAGYLTAFLEDAPHLSAYNYEKIGFIHPPTDFYLRPFMLAVKSVHKWTPRKSYYYMECVGTETPDQVLLRYMESVRAVGVSSGLPSFIFTWLTHLAHGDLNAAQGGDDIYATFLEGLDLNNTILFFMSDHGYRYGPIRQSFAGWYEDKLPNFWVFLPPWIRDKYPEWNEGLATNSGRLTSPVDLHATFRQILDTFTPSKGHDPSKSRLSELGHTLFDPVPLERTCSDAGIPPNFCACSMPVELDVRDPRLFEAAQVALASLNSKLPEKKCAPLSLASIHAGGVVSRSQGTLPAGAVAPDAHNNETLLVAFYATPGDFLFEGNVERVVLGGENSLMTPVGDLLRMNKITRDVSCVSGDLEKFCYCQPS